ncbi:MAG: hypothetical protein HOH74_12440 [Gemmatimonadetes bacterium]|nr:hypothetical protein [Gemmatimonadota bacterium]
MTDVITLEAFMLGAAGLAFGWLTAWVDRRARARLEGRRRMRYGLWGSLARHVAALSRSGGPRFWPSCTAALNLLPALLLITILLQAILALRSGETEMGAMDPGRLLWWLALLLAAAASSRWVLLVMWPTSSQIPGGMGRRMLESVTPWFGLLVALVVLFLGVGLLPMVPHPIAAAGLIVAAGLWRQLDEQGRQAGANALTGAAADLLARVASHLTVAALILTALITSGVSSLLIDESTPAAGGAVVALFVLGVFLSRLSATVLMSAPTPQRLRRFTWGGLLPLAVVECLLSAALMAQVGR